MRIRATVRVESRIVLTAETVIENGAFRYCFTPGADGLLTSLSLETGVSRPEAFLSTVTPTPRPGIAAHFHLVTDADTLADLEREFQALESHLALAFPLERIRWDELALTLLPETPEETSRLSVSAFAIRHGPRALESVSRDDLEHLITVKDKFADFVVPLSFYREGVNDVSARRFINAFVAFYYILEGLFGDGQTKNYAVQRAFEASDELVVAIPMALEMLRTSAGSTYRALLDHLGGEEPSASAVLALLVKTRGALHHFTGNPTRPGASPLTHKRYEALAHFLHVLVLRVFLMRIVAINNGKA